MNVWLSTHLRSYTSQRASVTAEGATLAALLADLERRHPGLRFRLIDEQDRIREHFRIYVNGGMAPDLSVAISGADDVRIIGALSGG